MNNSPSPYPEANQPGYTGQTQQSEMLYDYSHVGSFPQPDYPPTQAVYPDAQQTIYPDAQSDYATYPAYANMFQPNYGPIKKNWDNLWIVLTAIALFLLVAIGSIYYYLQVRSTPTRTLQAYCNAIKNDDGQALYNTYSSAAQAQTDVPRLQQGLKLVEFLSGGIEDCMVDTNSLQENNPQAIGRITFLLDNGRMSSATLRLIDENGQWRIEDNTILP